MTDPQERRGTGGLMLPPARLTFACELDRAQLADLFADSSVIDDLRALNARVALMCSDFSDERAGVVRRLNAAGVPVVGIPLLPLAEGYYFTADNADRAAACYRQFIAWTRRHELAWDGVGLDIEPDARIFLQIMENPWGLVISPHRSIWWSWLWVVGMVGYAATVARRRAPEVPHLLGLALASFAAAVVVTLGVLFGLHVFPLTGRSPAA